jgi:hypothetical protein
MTLPEIELLDTTDLSASIVALVKETGRYMEYSMTITLCMTTMTLMTTATAADHL